MPNIYNPDDQSTTSALRKIGATEEDFIKATTLRSLPGVATSNFSFGTHALRPSSGAQGDLYFESDRHWLFYYTGIAWAYLDGINKGTDAARAAIIPGAAEEGAWFYVTDTKAWWEVVSGAWVAQPESKLYETGGPTTLDIGAIANNQFLQRSGSTVVGAAVAPTTATYITQTPDAGLSAEQALSALATGYLKNTTATGVLTSQAVPIPITDGGTNATSAANARTQLGLVIGTDVEAHDPDLTTIAGLAPANDDVIQRKAGVWTNRTVAQLKSDLALNNVPNVDATNMGNATAGTLAVTRGGTGVTTSTGTGSVVLSASPSLTGTITVGAGALSPILRIDGGTGAALGPSMEFRAGGTLNGFIGAYAVNQGSGTSQALVIGTYNALDVVFNSASGIVKPLADNNTSLGAATFRWSVVYAATGTINTSDAKEKRLLKQPDQAFFDAILSVPQKWFQWKDAIKKKGKEGARIHYGPTAQGVRDALLKAGYDPGRYALFVEEKGTMGLRLDQYDRYRTEALFRLLQSKA